ncbi:MAG TPA: hypothetical protein VE172_11160 [Stackebrandtia sp.]|jgi:hypothetical protein|uniref:hypothetical protein n=1 Tax=Stackebrandtia sp. TaxID=2023065 RepID=UPI002D444595|nr:hypothetical protein [Stackebrandtia sp.]HZE39359.1 hypothetical protein [Stackebrandtia sp.]
MTKPMRIVCYTCGGAGDIPIPRAYLNSTTKKIEARYVHEECWFCQGEGRIIFARRRR